MAVSIQQPSIRESWDALLANHPRWRAFFSFVAAILAFFIHGHFVIVIGRWAVMTGGRIAETAMLLSVLWITAARVAPEFVVYVPLHDQITSTCIIALSLLPEIILFHAIIVCFDHWREALRSGEKVQVFHLTFAILYTIPTGLFIGMTVWTLILTATTGTVITANGLLLSARYLAGWFYSLVEMIYPLIARRYNMIVTQQTFLVDEQSTQEMEHLMARVERLQERVEQLQNTQTVTLKNNTGDVPEDDTLVTGLEDNFVSFEEQESIHISPRITTPLGTRDIDTDEMKVVNKPKRRSVNKSSSNGTRGDAYKRVMSVLKKFPDISPTELAKKANVSRPYASKIRSQMSA